MARKASMLMSGLWILLFGWWSMNNCELLADKGKLKVKVLGEDPNFQTAKVPDAVGPVKIRFRMKADAAGNGRVYWSTDKKTSFVGNFAVFQSSMTKNGAIILLNFQKFRKKTI